MTSSMRIIEKKVVPQLIELLPIFRVAKCVA